MKNNWSRRKFIKLLGRSITLGMGFLALTKWLPFAQANPPLGKKNPMLISNKNKVLVTYESQFGSTAEVAEVVGQVLGDKGYKVTIKKIKDVVSLDNYEKVVIGSAIQYDKWMLEAREFAQAHQRELETKNVSCFFVCLVLSKGTEKSRTKANGYARKIKELVPRVSQDAIGQFAGVLDYSKMSFGQRLAAKTLFAIIGVKAGDYRDWEIIRNWASQS